MKLDLKQLLLYAIVPAIVAGLFSIAPKAYEVVFETKAGLDFTLTTGPQIASEGTVQQVVSVKVSNSGKKPLTAISAELSVPGASLLASSVDNSSGLAIEQTRSDGKVIVQLPKALPGETFSISAMVKSATPSIAPTFVVRSDEVLGKPAEVRAVKQDFKLTLLGAASAALSVLAMAIFGLKKVQTIVMPSKRTAIMYVTLACQDDGLTAAVRSEGDDISYMQFADMLLARGRTSEEARQRSVAGLRCLREIAQMADVSQAVVRRNLAVLVGGTPTAEEKGLSEKFLLGEPDVVAFRDFVDEMFGTMGSSAAA